MNSQLKIQTKQRQSLILYAIKIGCLPQEAEDIVQDVLLQKTEETNI